MRGQQAQAPPAAAEKPRVLSARVKVEGSAVAARPAPAPTPPAKVDPLERLQGRARAIGGLLWTLLDQFEKWDSKKEPVFLWEPNDTVVPGYSSIVSRPMAWTTMRSKLQQGQYETIEQFSLDVLQIVDNAMVFNPEGTFYYLCAVKLAREARKVSEQVLARERKR